MTRHIHVTPKELTMPTHIHVRIPTWRSARIAIWHAAFCHWYDSRDAGRLVRARMWGRVADFLCP